MTLWIYIFFTNNVTNFQLLLVRHFSSFLVRICGVIPKYPQQFPILSFCSLLFRNDCIWRANSLALLWFHCLIIRGHQAINSTESPSAEAVSAAGSAAACCSVSVSSPANTATGKSVYAHIASECSGAWSEKEPAQLSRFFFWPSPTTFGGYMRIHRFTGRRIRRGWNTDRTAGGCGTSRTHRFGRGRLCAVYRLMASNY